MTVLTKKADRQYALTATADLIWSDAVVGGVAGAVGTTAVAAVDLPANAIVTGGFVVVDTVWNSSGTTTFAIGDGTTADRYKTATTLKTAGLTALVPTGFKYTAPDTVDITVVVAGSTASAGAGRLVVTYIVDGRGNEVQG